MIERLFYTYRPGMSEAAKRRVYRRRRRRAHGLATVSFLYGLGCGVLVGAVLMSVISGS